MKTTSIFLGIFAFISLIYITNAERVLTIDLEVFKDNSVKVNKIILMEGNPTVYIAPGDYKLIIFDYESNVIEEIPINLVFMIMTDPPTPTDSAFINLRLPYKQEMQILKLFNKDREIFSTKIELCNNDNACDINYENFLSCPEDCPLDKKDGICIKEADDICDPDCSEGVDEDCKAIITTFEITTSITTEVEKTTTTQQIKDSAISIPVLVSIIAITISIFTFIIIFLYKKKTGVKIKEDNRIISYVKEKLQQGEDPEILKRGLEAEGYDPGIVDKFVKEIQNENFK